MKLKEILIYVLVWRLLLTLVALIGILLVPYKDSFPHQALILAPYGPPILHAWANFDGVHYLTIAEGGYYAQYTQAFFPFYPALMALIDELVGNMLVSGLIISHLAFILALFYLSKLIQLDFDPLVARRTILLYLAFPTSFFFASLYTESLFLLLVVTTFYFIRVGDKQSAIILAATTSATRVIGAMLLPSLVTEHLENIRVKRSKYMFKKFSTWLGMLPLLASVTGLLAYMAYLYRQFSDPIYFLSVQPAFGADRSDKLILLYQVVYRYIKMFFTVDPFTLVFYNISLEFVSSMVALTLLYVAYRRKMRLSYLVYSLGAYVLPTLTGTFSSMPRYVLVLFPIFIVMGHIKNLWLFRGLALFFGTLLILNTIMFVRGYWVA